MRNLCFSAIKNEDKHIRERAARILGKIHDTRAVEPLIQALKDEYKNVRKSAAWSLGMIKNTRAVKPLIQALKDKERFVPSTASDAVTKIGEPAVKDLIQALKDEDSTLTVRYLASESLGEIGNPAVEPLIQALQDLTWNFEWGAIALGKAKDKRAVPLLINALKSEDKEIRWRAAKILGKFKDPRSVEPLTDVLKDEYDLVGSYAAISLTEIGEPALKPLINASSDACWKVRSHAVWALGEIGGRRVVNLLIDTVKDEHWKVREKAAVSLGKILKREKFPKNTEIEATDDALREIEEQVVESLVPLLKDNHGDVRCEAVRALWMIKNAKVVEPLREALTEENEKVRRLAAKALEEQWALKS